MFINYFSLRCSIKKLKNNTGSHQSHTKSNTTDNRFYFYTDVMVFIG